MYELNKTPELVVTLKTRHQYINIIWIFHWFYGLNIFDFWRISYDFSRDIFLWKYNMKVKKMTDLEVRFLVFGDCILWFADQWNPFSANNVVSMIVPRDTANNWKYHTMVFFGHFELSLRHSTSLINTKVWKMNLDRRCTKEKFTETKRKKHFYSKQTKVATIPA